MINMDAAREAELYLMEVDLLLEQVGRVAMKAAVAEAVANGELVEGAWTGSMGGHDPDQLKLKNGLMDWWRKKVATDPHPFAYCVRHLRKHVANPERLCAWLKDQALGTTKWRKGNKKMSEAGGHCRFCTEAPTKMVVHPSGEGFVEVCSQHVAAGQNAVREAGGAQPEVRQLTGKFAGDEADWEPSLDELKAASAAYAEAEAELDDKLGGGAGDEEDDAAAASAAAGGGDGDASAGGEEPGSADPEAGGQSEPDPSGDPAGGEPSGSDGE